MSISTHSFTKLARPQDQSSQREVVVPFPTIHLTASERTFLESQIPLQMWEPPLLFFQSLGFGGILYLFLKTLTHNRSFSFITRQPSLDKLARLFSSQALKPKL